MGMGAPKSAEKLMGKSPVRYQELAEIAAVASSAKLKLPLGVAIPAGAE